jgi:hypothetical protein
MIFLNIDNHLLDSTIHIFTALKTCFMLYKIPEYAVLVNLYWSFLDATNVIVCLVFPLKSQFDVVGKIV